MNRLKYIWRKILRIIQWIPVLWNDEDWDYGHLLTILDFKLKRMVEFFESDYAYSADGPRKIKQIKIVRSHIDHYYDIGKYYPVKNWPVFILDVQNALFDRTPLPGYVKRHFEREEILREWHWQEIWRRVDKYGRNWWD